MRKIKKASIKKWLQVFSSKTIWLTDIWQIVYRPKESYYVLRHDTFMSNVYTEIGKLLCFVYFLDGLQACTVSCPCDITFAQIACPHFMFTLGVNIIYSIVYIVYIGVVFKAITLVTVTRNSYIVLALATLGELMAKVSIYSAISQV